MWKCAERAGAQGSPSPPAWCGCVTDGRQELLWPWAGVLLLLSMVGVKLECRSGGARQGLLQHSRSTHDFCFESVDGCGAYIAPLAVRLVGRCQPGRCVALTAGPVHQNSMDVTELLQKTRLCLDRRPGLSWCCRLLPLVRQGEAFCQLARKV